MRKLFNTEAIGEPYVFRKIEVDMYRNFSNRLARLPSRFDFHISTLTFGPVDASGDGPLDSLATFVARGLATDEDASAVGTTLKMYLSLCLGGAWLESMHYVRVIPGIFIAKTSLYNF